MTHVQKSQIETSIEYLKESLRLAEEALKSETGDFSVRYKISESRSMALGAIGGFERRIVFGTVHSYTRWRKD
jgi:hypothetical protein